MACFLLISWGLDVAARHVTWHNWGVRTNLRLFNQWFALASISLWAIPPTVSSECTRCTRITKLTGFFYYWSCIYLCIFITAFTSINAKIKCFILSTLYNERSNPVSKAPTHPSPLVPPSAIRPCNLSSMPCISSANRVRRLLRRSRVGSSPRFSIWGSIWVLITSEFGQDCASIILTVHLFIQQKQLTLEILNTVEV